MNLSRYSAPLQKLLAPLAARQAGLTAHLQSKPTAFWQWLGGTAFAGLLSLIFLYRIVGVLPEQLGQDAFYHGRRVTLDLGSGETVGGSHSQSAVTLSGGKTGRGSTRALSAAPYEPITEATLSGPLPKAHGSLVPWQYYAKPYTPATDNPRIAIIIADLGMQLGDTDAILHLPPQMTFSLSPYASHVAELNDRLRGLGYETMVDVPLQPGDYPYSDPGPYAMTTGNNDKANLDALHEALSRFSGYIGGVATDEVVTGSESQMPLLVKECTNRGIILVYARNSGNVRWGALPFSNAWSALHGVLLDDQLDLARTKENLKKLISSARIHTFAIGIIRPYGPSLQALQDWLPTLEGHHVELVPLSQIARDQYHIFTVEAPVEKKSTSEHGEGGEHGEAAAPEHGAKETPAAEEGHGHE